MSDSLWSLFFGGGGHQFVIDGYASDNFYYVNWGWSGVSNGYQLISVMNPPVQGVGYSSSDDGFTKKHDVIIGIQPDSNNPGGFYNIIAYKSWYGHNTYSILSDVDEYHEGSTLTITLKDFQNKGSRAFLGKLAVTHFSNEGIL